MRHLFIGGGGLVGKAAVQVAKDSKLDWLATYRELLDLSQQPFTNLPTDIDTVYLIAAVRTPSDCDKNPVGTWVINADAPVELALHYFHTGAFIVFVSSDNVKGAGSTYANQKRYAECHIRPLDAAIIRPGRIHPDRAVEFARFMLKIGSKRQAGLYHWD
jgi:dTDP-4-dehydrorhamnose reductase